LNEDVEPGTGGEQQRVSCPDPVSGEAIVADDLKFLSP
jgi:hypothetical protein